MADATFTPGSADVHDALPRRAQTWRDSKALKRFRRNPLAIVGLIVVFVFVMTAILAPVLTTVGRNCLRDMGLSAATQTDYKNPTKPAFWKAMFAPPDSCFTIPRAGFGNVPRSAEASDTLLGTTSGGYDIGGAFDNVLMRFTDVIISLPSLVVAMVVVMVLGNSIGNIMFAIAVVAWPSYARLMRGEVLRVKEEDFVTSARALGRRPLGVIFRHVLPNAIGPLIIIASLDIGSIVLTAAALSFLGLGADVGYADWGQMISFARDWILGPPGQPFFYWYVSFWPGIIIVLFVLGWNLLGDAFRDVLDPRSH
jgi:peptide/nickel transport system permease protein